MLTLAGPAKGQKGACHPSFEDLFSHSGQVDLVSGFTYFLIDRAGNFESKSMPSPVRGIEGSFSGWQFTFDDE